MTTLEQLSHFADVPVRINVELDRKILTLRQMLELGEGSVIKMSRSAGENLDVMAGGALLGFGEIVIIENTMGIRITDFKNED